MGWDPKSEKAGWWLLFLFPVIAGCIVPMILVPFIRIPPIVLVLIFLFIFVVGLIIVCKRAGKNDKKE